MINTSTLIEFLLDCYTSVNVIITKKRMKNIRLIITKTGEVKLNIPSRISYNYAYQFLERKRDWISNQLIKIKSNIAKNCCNFTDGGNIFLMGYNYPLKVEISTKNKVFFNPNTSETNCGFIIYIKDSKVDIKNIFIKWCKKYFLDFFSNRLNYLYSQMFKNTTPPIVKIKTMKSMWGNCNFVKNIITLNLYLAKANIECIDYVIIHELAHLVHHNHGNEFHNLMTKLLPDWKSRKKLLNTYSLGF